MRALSTSNTHRWRNALVVAAASSLLLVTTPVGADNSADDPTTTSTTSTTVVDDPSTTTTTEPVVVTDTPATETTDAVVPAVDDNIYSFGRPVPAIGEQLVEVTFDSVTEATAALEAVGETDKAAALETSESVDDSSVTVLIAVNPTEAAVLSAQGASVRSSAYVRNALTPNDPCATGACGIAAPWEPPWEEWWQAANLDDAWNLETGSAGIVVAIVDDGVRQTHEDLDGKVVGTYDCVYDFDGGGGSNNIAPYNTICPSVAGPLNDVHGTSVASLAAAETNNATDVAGAGYNVSFMDINVFFQPTAGGSFATPIDLANGVITAVHFGADVINMSLETTVNDPNMAAAMNHAIANGVVLVAAAGNVNNGVAAYPASYPQVISVGAAQEGGGPYGTRTSFTNTSSSLDIVAPGNALPAASISPANGVQSFSGTSAATPVVSGTAGLLLSQQSGDTSTAAILRRISGTGVWQPSGSFHLDAYRALTTFRPLPTQPTVGASMTAYDVAGQPRYVVGAGAGSPPFIVEFDSTGTKVREFLGQDWSFRGGVSVAVGDVIPGSPGNEYVVGAGTGGDPRITVFNSTGTVALANFLATGVAFRGGVDVAVGDVDPAVPGVEIIAGYGVGADPRIGTFTGTGVGISTWLATGLSFRGGVNVAAGDITGTATAEVVAGFGPGGDARVMVFNGVGTATFLNFVAYNGFTGGSRVAVGEVSPGVRRIVTSPGPGGWPRLTAFNSAGVQTSDVVPFRDNFTVGGDPAVHPAGSAVSSSSFGGEMRIDIDLA